MKLTMNYINEYFSNHLNGSQIEGVTYLQVALDEFLRTETKENARAVYTGYFDCFRMHLEGSGFIDLLDALLAYEENSAVLLEKQRDHLVHSVNVFVLGLSIYTQNASFRNVFKDSGFYAYKGVQSTSGEEFLYRWGLAALLHDIGYPVEIIHNQFKAFIKFVGEADGKISAKPYLDYFDFASLNNISEVLYKSVFIKDFISKLPADIKLDALKPTDLLAYNFHATLGVSYPLVQEAVNGFLATMQKSGFVDHGFYSALILLKWYGYLVQRSGLPADVLYHPVLDSAGAIYLHNYYRNVLMKPPFSLAALSASDHPIGFLLILCDELQEWNRTAYGSKDKKRILAEASEIEINNEALRVHYKTTKGVMSEDFGPEKEAFLNNVLSLSALFSKGIHITQTTASEQYMADIMQKDTLIARPLLANLEKMAKHIHAGYVDKRRADDMRIEYPAWESLPDTLKYSNIRQARSVYSKLLSCGYAVFETPQKGKEQVFSFTPEQIEVLAREEHDEWVTERLNNGWTHGKVRDAERKQSPYLVPYTALSETIKDYDRDSVRNIFPMLEELHLYVYKSEDGTV